ncbi:MAG: M23 family metallopeptidase [Elainellaceae cyanobacterium]
MTASSPRCFSHSHPNDSRRSVGAWLNGFMQNSGAIALGTLLTSLCSTAIGAAMLTAEALEVEIYPPNPQQGDTLSVRIQTDTATPEAVSVTMNQRVYPVYPLGAGSNAAAGNAVVAPGTVQQFQTLLPTTPLDTPGQVTIQISDGEDVRNMAVWLRDRSFPTQRITLRGGGSGLTEIEAARVQAFKEIVTPQRFWNGPLLRPTSGSVSTVFGVQRYYNGVFANDYYHRGVDYATGTGTPVVAPAAGRIALVGYESQGFRIHGNTVGIDHGQGVLSIFIHLNGVDVQEGDLVQAGQRVGSVGSTGSSTGPHLHWGLYVHGMAVDPVPWRYEGIQ